MTHKVTKVDVEKDELMAKMEAALELLSKLSNEAMKGKVLSLSLWPADLVGTPNVILRTALFRLMEHVKPGERPFSIDEVIASVRGEKERIEIRFTGRQFNQTDLDFFEAVLQLAGHPDVEYVTHEDGQRMMAVSGYAVLKMIGRKDSSREYKLAHESFVRLREGITHITVQRAAIPASKGFPGREAVDIDVSGPLILHARENGLKGRHLIALNPLLKPLFEPGAFSLINLPLRLSLKKDLSKWLLGFYSTHARPLPYSLDKLHKSCGSAMKNRTTWRNLVKSAHDELVAVGFLNSYEIDRFGNVQVERAPKHISNKQLKTLMQKSAETEAIDPRQEALPLL